ncbi:MAG: hypothetical protein ABFD76_15310 [Smithella sp.]
MGGDFVKEEFTDEEKAALGEVDDSKNGEGKPPEEADRKDDKPPEDEKPPEDGKPPEGKTDEEVKPDAETQAVIDEQGAKLITENGKQYVVDDEGAKIPLERFKKVYGRSKELQRENEEIKTKHNLFKILGAEKYYEIYPSEKPADFQPAKPPIKEKPVDIYALQVTGGEYDGYTLKEVADSDPVAAQILVNNYYEQQRQKKEADKALQDSEAKKEAEFRESFEREKKTFLGERAKELFSKDKDFTQEEINQVVKVYDNLSKWMINNKKTHYSLEDAYLIFNRDDIMKRERTKASQDALKKATEKPLSAIGNGDSNAGLTGYENVMAMSENELTSHIDKMTDKAAAKFFKEAPKSLKDKYPALPWS